MKEDGSRVILGARCGWVRVFNDEDDDAPGTLVYLTHNTIVSDICRDLVLADHLTLWLQYGGGEGRRLGATETPLLLQDEFLRRIGYSDNSRRARLGIDPDLRFIIRFYIGPASSELIERSGSIYILKGHVLPQWKKRTVVLMANKMYIHPGIGVHGSVEEVDVGGATVEATRSTKCGRKVLRISASRQLFLGFDFNWERSLWWSWIAQASETEASSEKVDLSGAGLSELSEAAVRCWPDVQQLNLARNRLSTGLHLLGRLHRLQALCLADNKWNALPADLTKLTNLTCLDLSDNQLATLPDNFTSLSRLEELRLDRNGLKALPGRRGAYPRLKTLSLAHNKLVALPPFLDNDPAMRELTLLDVGEGKEDENAEIGEDLRSINLRANLLKGSIILGNYGNLTHLDVSENSIETLDLSALDKLENVQCSRNQLQELSLNGNSLQSLIAGNNKLKKLTVAPRPSQLNHLDISYNELEMLPEWIAGCQHLRTLFASHNHLTSLPDHLFCNELSCLQTLQLSFNRLSALPAVIRQIPLQQLFLQSNRITALPEHFFLASVRMRVLNITNNCLTMLPNVVGENHQLERLYLSCNSLNCISILSKLRNIRSLHLAYNSITHLPDSCVSSWSELEEILISGNQIQYLPGNITKLQHLRVLRIHSNNLRSCPSLSGMSGLRVLDLAHNQLDRVNLANLVPKKLQFLDISGNSRLHVDARQFQMYRTQRAMSLVDVSGQNRTSLPSSPPPQQDMESCDLDAPWNLGFTETPGHRDRLCISQLRQPEFCNNEALIGLFDAENNSELPQMLVKITPRILLEERTVEETANDYMKYTMLSAHRELKDKGQRCGVCAMLCHITKQKSQHNKHRYMLRIASVGEAKSVLCRSSGVVTLAHTPTQIQAVKSQLGSSSMFPLVVPDPHVAEVLLTDNDEFIIMANKRIWEVLSVEEAVSIVRPMSDPGRAAKKLQDVAQSYGCEDNLSIIILRFHISQNDTDPLIKELRSTIKRATLPKDPLGLYDSTHNELIDGDCDRSSPSGQSDQASSGRTILCHNERFQQSLGRHYNASEKNDFVNPRNYQSVLMHENGTRKLSTSKKTPDVYTNGNFADGEETSSDRSGTHLSEEQYRCWEYMLEQNTQLLFDKELDTLSRGFVRRSVPSRPGLWVRAKSSPHISTDFQQPLLTRQFGSARSFQQTGGRMNNNRRGLTGGPNAAYFGSLQRLMPYHLEYDFAVIRERADSNTDSLEHDDRMQKYWDVTTTEL